MNSPNLLQCASVRYLRMKLYRNSLIIGFVLSITYKLSPSIPSKTFERVPRINIWTLKCTFLRKSLKANPYKWYVVEIQTGFINQQKRQNKFKTILSSYEIVHLFVSKPIFQVTISKENIFSTKLTDLEVCNKSCCRLSGTIYKKGAQKRAHLFPSLVYRVCPFVCASKINAFHASFKGLYKRNIS